VVCKREDLSKKHVQKKFGSMYDGIRTTSLLPALYTTVFSVRRLVIVLVLLVL